MGRIKTTVVKTLAEDIIRENAGKFGEDFEKNKKALGEIKEISSKKIRNVLTGYITRRMKQINKSGL